MAQRSLCADDFHARDFGNCLPLFDGRPDETSKQRMAIHRARLKFRMKLTTEKPRLVLYLNDFNQVTIRGQAAQHHAFSAELGTVSIVELVAVTVFSRPYNLAAKVPFWSTHG